LNQKGHPRPRIRALDVARLTLARDFGTKRFSSEAYAVEEFVAERGAAFLCADLDLAPEPREDHASYAANWLKVLKDDNRAIFTARIAGVSSRCASRETFACGMNMLHGTIVVQ
jgi:antirestriction protein ArdC